MLVSNTLIAIATCSVAMLQRSPPAPAMLQQIASTVGSRRGFSKGSNFSWWATFNWCLTNLRIAAKPAEPSSVVLDGCRQIIGRRREIEDAKCDLEASRAFGQDSTLRVIFEIPSWG